MATPLGLTYNRQFPSLSNIIAQAQQLRQLTQRQLYEQNKTAEQRAYDTVKDAYKFSVDPIITIYGSWGQEVTGKVMELAAGVRAKKVDPLFLESFMSSAKLGATRIQNFKKETDAFVDIISKNKKRNPEEATRIISQEIMLPGDGSSPRHPEDLNAPLVRERIDNSLSSYRADVIAQDFVNLLHKKFEISELGLSGSNFPGLGIEKTTTGLPSKYLGKVNDKGSRVVNVSLNNDGSNSQQTNELLALFKADKDNANFLRLTVESLKKEDGTKPSEGQALQFIMSEHGFAEPKVDRKYRVLPQAEQDAAGTKFDPKRIGGSRKTEASAYEGADFVAKLLSPGTQKSALSSFKSPRYKSVSVNNGVLTIEMTTSGREDLMSIAAIFYESEDRGQKEIGEKMLTDFSGNQNRVDIELTPENIGEIINYLNFAQEGSAWSGPLIKQAFDKKYGGAKKEIVDF